MTHLMLMLVQDIRRVAMLNYERSYGWQEVQECWTDEEIAEELEENQITTEDRAIMHFREIVKIRTEYADEIRSTAW